MDDQHFRSLIKSLQTVAETEALVSFLEEQGTFSFPALENGLFPAAIAHESTGYQSIWVRDNIHVAHALNAVGKSGPARKAISTLTEYFTRHRDRFDQIISGQASPAEVMKRPHIRFDGNTLGEIDEKWAHAQNDALGYYVWFYCLLLSQGKLEPVSGTLELLAAFVRYFESIRYWEDADSGHWEETRKIEASSIGTVVSGLKMLKRYLDQSESWNQFRYAGVPITADSIDLLIQQGQAALDEILPAECIQEDPLLARKYDGALLFLIFPLGLVQGEMAEKIMEDVRSYLMGEYGIRRYLGDSYWCADYKDMLGEEDRTVDFSDDQSSRDKLLKPGQEAQWCIFDSVLSVIYGQRFLQSEKTEDYEKQRFHLDRSLGQLTTSESVFGPYKCPESYYLEKGRYVPNDITPLLWTQGNLMMALQQWKQTLKTRIQ
ncbi:glycoside hydrolase family 15 protein [Gimesia sp.]|uniref:glycoside hydrolase family 15 protein n=1 Tax=Gimesia sp. TaxID=2024833 RepID=UPI003A8DC4F9